MTDRIITGKKHPIHHDEKDEFLDYIESEGEIPEELGVIESK